MQDPRASRISEHHAPYITQARATQATTNVSVVHKWENTVAEQLAQWFPNNVSLFAGALRKNLLVSMEFCAILCLN